MGKSKHRSTSKSRRAKLQEIIFGTDTPAGKAFDIVLLWSIVLSVLVVLLESVPDIRSQHGQILRNIEWMFTILFTVEYGLRIYCVDKKLRYIKSFFGVIDLLSVIPTYLSLYIVGTQSFLVIRCIRLLRIFRVLKLVRYSREAERLMAAIRASRAKITVFIGAILSIAVIIGAAMYLIEGTENGYSSIPVGMYWAIVTMTTVGYGDLSPQTPLGQILASILMVMGYGIITVPTGIVTVELAKATVAGSQKLNCKQCKTVQHSDDAVYCRICGKKLGV